VDIPWKEMESQGWIAEAKCHEIRLPLPVEQDFALKRQLFLCEQGYEYVILDASELS
jgi:hypothetical protein